MSALDGHLGLIMGATIAAMLANGEKPEEIREQFELGLKSAAMVRADLSLAKPMGEAAVAFAAKVMEA